MILRKEQYDILMDAPDHEVKQLLTDMVDNAPNFYSEIHKETIKHELEYLWNDFVEDGVSEFYLNSDVEHLAGTKLTPKMFDELATYIENDKYGIIISGDEMSDLLRDAVSYILVHHNK